MVDISDIKKAEDPIKHATETYLWIIEKGLLPTHVCFFKKVFLLRIKRLFFVLPSQDQYFKERKKKPQKNLSNKIKFTKCLFYVF